MSIVKEIPAHQRALLALCFTRDGKRLVSAGQDGAIHLWKMAGFSKERSIEGHERGVHALSLAIDERSLATSSADGTVRLWEFPSGAPIAVLHHQTLAAFAPDGTALASVSTAGEVVLFEADGSEERATLPGPGERVGALAFAPDGQRLFLAAGERVHVLELETGGYAEPLLGHTGYVGGLALAPDDCQLATSGGEGAVRLWWLADLSLARALALPGRGTLQMAFDPDGKELAVTLEGGLCVLSLKSGSVRERLDVAVKGVHSIAWSGEGRWLACGAADGKLRLWERR